MTARTCAFCNAEANTKVQLSTPTGIKLAPIWTCGKQNCGSSTRRKDKPKRVYHTPSAPPSGDR